MNRLSLLALVAFGALLMFSSNNLQAQYFNYGLAPGAGDVEFTDPRLGFCLENDCFRGAPPWIPSSWGSPYAGHGGGYGSGYGGGYGSGYGGCSGGHCGGYGGGHYGGGGYYGGGYGGGHYGGGHYGGGCPGGNCGYGVGYGAGYGGHGNAIIVRVRVGDEVVDVVPTVQTYYPGVANPYDGSGNNRQPTTGSTDLRNINAEVFAPGQLRPTTPLLRNQPTTNSAPAQQTSGGYRYKF